jgi:hypothetical protein
MKRPSIQVQKEIAEFAAANPAMKFKAISVALGYKYADVSYAIRRHLPDRKRVCDVPNVTTSPVVPHNRVLAFYEEHPEMSYRKMGLLLGLSGERVRQIARKHGLSPRSRRPGTCV